MKVIIKGDDSKMIDNFTEIMCEITLQRIKDNNFELRERRLSNLKDGKLVTKEDE